MSKAKILIVKLSSLGDLFHALPAVHLICREFDTKCDLAVQTEYVKLVECFSDVEQAIPVPRHSIGLKQVRQLYRDIRMERYELVVDLQGLMKSAVIARLAKSARCVGPAFAREGSQLLYKEIARAAKDGADGKQVRHAVERNLDTCSYLNIARIPVAFPVDFPAVALKGPRPWIAVTPVSRWETKNWPLERFADAAAKLAIKTKGTIVLLGGAGDAAATAQIAAAVRRCGGNVFDAAGQYSLPQSGGCLAACDLLISNDSGPVHMAAAAGTRVLALFGPTDPSRTGPYGDRHIVLQGECGEMHCYERKCPFGANPPPCMDFITVEQVVDTALRMLD